MQAGGQDGQPLPPYGDLLQQREYELWQRQNRLYDQLLEQHERDRQQWESERQRWVQQEASLKQEVAELRAQLLYLLQSGGVQPRSPSDARSAVGSMASSSLISSLRMVLIMYWSSWLMKKTLHGHRRGETRTGGVKQESLQAADAPAHRKTGT